jgi:hypothetical protein
MEMIITLYTIYRFQSQRGEDDEVAEFEKRLKAVTQSTPITTTTTTTTKLKIDESNFVKLQMFCRYALLNRLSSPNKSIHQRNSPTTTARSEE